MKKILTLLSIIAVILTACSGVKTMNPDRLKIDKAYKFTANMQYGEFNAVAEFERSDAEVWEVVLLEPFALEGLSLTYNHGEISTQFDELSGVMSGGSVAELIINAFENAVNGEGREVISYGEEIKVTSKAGSPAKSYTLILDKGNLEPLSLKMPEALLTVSFSGVHVSQIVPVILPREPDVNSIPGLIPHDD